MTRRLLRLLTWLAGLAILAGLLLLARAVNEGMRQDRAAESDASAPLPKRGERGVVKLGSRLAASHGLQDEPARAASWVPRLTVYGRVVPNPRATLEVRAPFAGILREGSAAWPAVGQWLRSGQSLARLDIRVGPLERLDLQARRNEARRKELGAAESLKVHEERVERLKKLVSPEVVARRQLDDAALALAEARAQAAVARSAAELWEKALRALGHADPGGSAEWSELLTAPAGGEVTDAPARPGTAVEAGGLVVRLVDFRRPLIRLDLPPEALANGPLSQVDVQTDALSAPVPAQLVGPAPQVDVVSQRDGYLYEAHLLKRVWRPGRFVRAVWQRPGDKPQAAVAVPLSALLVHQGRSLLYVRIGPGRYERREVQILGRDGDRWVLSSGVSAGEPVVCRQAQVLLSEEFRGDADD